MAIDGGVVVIFNSHMAHFTKFVVLFALLWGSLACLKAIQAAPQDEEATLFKNPTLEWKDGELEHWTIAKGAGANRGKNSVVERAEDESLQLSGDRSTRIWNYVSQAGNVTPGQTLVLEYSVKTTGVIREDNQFDNCYVGIWFKDARGQRVGRAIFPANSEAYVPNQFVLEVPTNASKAELSMFLSKTGRLNVKDLSVRLAKPDESFQLLVNQMDRYYSYFDHKKIDWKSLTVKYQKQATGNATDPKKFINSILPMLAELKDGHVWVRYNGRTQSLYQSDFKPNFDFDVVNKQLAFKKSFGRLGLVGKTKDGVGYVRVTSLQAKTADMQRLITAIDDMGETTGMVVDLRMNSGGSEPLGAMLASVFCKQQVVYAKQKFRLNQKHDEFFELTRGPLPARSDKAPYEKPVICLIGPRTVSSAEGTAMMFSALPNARLIGMPTRGSSGNPQPVMLPNGVEVWFSRWVAMTADGHVIEDQGVLPDIKVEHGAGDPAWEKALEELSSK